MSRSNIKKTASILVVDDEKSVRHSIANILRTGLPYARVRMARSGKEAIKKFYDEPCDIVLLDMKMPGMDGITVFKELRKTNYPFRAIVVSAFVFEFERIGKTMGIDSFITKPILSPKKKEVFLNTVRVNLASLGKKDALGAPFATVFCAMPFSGKFYDRYLFGIKAAAEVVGLECIRVDEMIFTSDVIEEIHDSIQKADIVVAELTEKNPNVYYEVGYARAKGKPVVFLAESAENQVFDLRNMRHIFYEGKIHVLLPKLEETLRELLKKLDMKL